MAIDHDKQIKPIISLHRFIRRKPFVSLLAIAIFVSVPLIRTYFSKLGQGEDPASFVRELVFVAFLGIAFFFFAGRMMLWLVIVISGYDPDEKS